ncbi:unnamed protein product [Rotaria magnacalcarata]|uniref:Uncharacterized protein n=1 Tax=Rotaria magnacalcarata TaxID=392030 RepID=A0A820GSH2_9BILA|nr:unnamed protein product [Rotaria magnacalcarata]CAF4284446.1 unnamed protein product [Rotaria magnacalcarata]
MESQEAGSSYAPTAPPLATYEYPPSNPFNVPFYPNFPPKLVEPAPTLSYTLPQESPADEEQEEVTDRFGNVSWKSQPVVPFNPLGTVNYSSPHEWSWASHIKEINRVQARCHTVSIAHQTLARTCVANLMRERGIQEIRTGLNSSFNASSSMWGHRIMQGMSSPAPQHAHVEQDAVGLLTPPGYLQYPVNPPPQTSSQPPYPPHYQYPPKP